MATHTRSPWSRTVRYVKNCVPWLNLPTNLLSGARDAGPSRYLPAQKTTLGPSLHFFESPSCTAIPYSRRLSSIRCTVLLGRPEARQRLVMEMPDSDAS